MTVTVAPDLTADPSETSSSIAKAARVLRALASVGERDSGVTELSIQAGLPKSTTHRILAELIAEGLVARMGSRYQLGPGWFLLQGALASSEWLHLVEQAKTPLARLFERSRATVHLGVLQDDQVLYLEKLTATGGTAVPTRVGAHMPASCTAIGKSLLAHNLPVLKSVVSKRLPAAARASIVAPGQLLRQVEQARADGVAFDREESRAGVFCVAAPIFLDGKAVASVSMTRVGVRGLTPNDAAETRRTAAEIQDWLQAS
jgi:DNA-binding IclR family transcriptional regulator